MKPKKSLGQNFLTSEGAVIKIIKSAEIKKGETILEIGPGKGVLTSTIIKAGGIVTAIEKDNNLFELLKEKFKKEIKNKKLFLYNGDVLEYDFNKLKLMNNNYKVIANIPYYITGQIIRFLLSGKEKPSRVVIMLQKEVAKRVVAKDNKESLLSLSVKAYGNPKYIDTVNKGSFYPIPKVDSAILCVENISKDFFDKFNEETFFKIIHTAFSQKRKRLLGNLKKIIPNIEKLAAETNIEKNIRAEDMTLEDWKKLLDLYITTNRSH